MADGYCCRVQTSPSRRKTCVKGACSRYAGRLYSEGLDIHIAIITGLNDNCKSIGFRECGPAFRGVMGYIG